MANPPRTGVSPHVDTNGAKNKSGQWHIAVCDKPLTTPGILDNLIFGKDASHSFLALINPQGEIVEELHGFSVNTQSNEPATATMGLRQLFNALTSRKDKPVRTAHPNKLRVTLAAPNEVPGTLNQNAQRQVVFSGSYDEIHNRWNRALLRGKKINDRHVDYIAIGLKPGHPGQNCHSVTSDMLDAMGIKVELPPTFARPGFSRMIIKTISQDFPALSRATHKLHNSLSRLRKALEPESVLNKKMRKFEGKPGLSLATLSGFSYSG